MNDGADGFPRAQDTREQNPSPTDSPDEPVQRPSSRGLFPLLAVGFLDAFGLAGLQCLLVEVAKGVLRSHSDPLSARALVQAMVHLPFIFLLTPSGHLSDTRKKDLVIRRSSDAFLLLSLLAAVSFHLGSWIGAAVVLLLLSAQAAILSPAKYGLAREFAGSRFIAEVTGLQIALTTTGGLCALLLFGLAGMDVDGGPAETLHQLRWAASLLPPAAIAGWWFSRRISGSRLGAAPRPFPWPRYLSGRIFRESLAEAWSHPILRQGVIGLSMFFAVAQFLVSDLGAYLDEVAGSENPAVVAAILAAAGLGLAAGAIQAGHLSRNFIETGLIPASAAGISAFLFLLPSATHPAALGLVLLGLGFCGGLFLVPLQSLVLFQTRASTAGHIVAACNFWQAVAMLLFLALPFGLARAGVPHRAIFSTLGLISLAGSLWAIVQLPQSLVRTLIRGVFSSRYDLEVIGLDELPPEGGVLLVGNHISLLDWAFVQMASPRPVRFLMDRSHYEKWYLKWLLDWMGTIPLSAGDDGEAFAKARTILEGGGVVAVFPEGHLSRNGLLSTFQPEFEKAVRATGAAVVPFYVQGLWGSVYSSAAAGYRDGLLSLAARDITVAFGPRLPDSTSADDVRRAVQELSIVAWNDHVSGMRPLVSTWIRTAKRVGSAPAIFSHDGKDLSGTVLLAAVLAFSRKIEELSPGEPAMGLLLPTSSAGAIANLASLVRGRTVVNLNYTQPAEVVARCVQRAGVRTILSSHQFESKIASRGFRIEELEKVAKVLRMEDLKETIPKAEMVRQVLRAKFLPAWWLELSSGPRGVRLPDTAAIMFSSGSEGEPKGVELSHANMMGNIRQTGTVLNPTRDDVMLSSLPLFHAFGLTITTLMPLLEGIPIAMQPDPTDARSIGRACARHKVTIMCGAGTFMRIYAQSKAVHPLMFASLRLVVAGAEKLKPEVRHSFREKFGLEIYEGYGTTETTPVASTNLPDVLLDDFTVQVSNRPGTVGIPLPGSQFRIVDPDTMRSLPIGEAGLILIGGTQIMKGYLHDPERTARAVVEIDGKRWYKTGDKGRIDDDGFLWILDRYSRFAKIGGEMISLGQVEQSISDAGLVAPCEFAAVAVPDPGKGERIALLYAAVEGREAPDPEVVRDRIRGSGMHPLSQPSICLKVESVPRLGSGKADYVKTKELALSLLAG